MNANKSKKWGKVAGSAATKKIIEMKNSSRASGADESCWIGGLTMTGVCVRKN